MAFLRPLGDTIADLAGSAMGEVRRAGDPAMPRVTSLALSIPIDIRLASGGTELQGDLPLFRRRTAFDPEPAHLTIVLAEASS